MPYKNKDQQRAYQRRWIQRRRQEYFDMHGSCIKCGSSDNLCLHHKNKNAKISHKIWSWSNQRQLDELSKCVVMCERCHNHLHTQQSMRHGLSRYQAGCRCNICKKVKSIENKRNRRRVGREKKD